MFKWNYLGRINFPKIVSKAFILTLIDKFSMSWIQNNKERLIPILKFIGFDHKQWARKVMYDKCYKLINNLEPAQLDVLEISPGDNFQFLNFKSFKGTYYKDFDICQDKLDEKFDLIIADQVFEHLLYPYKATKNVLEMLKPNGYFLITTPFLIKIHPMPFDCTRWTPLGLKHFLHECGFALEEIHTDAWGNKACVRANLRYGWAPRGWFGSLKNQKYFPVVVWALAKKS